MLRHLTSSTFSYTFVILNLTLTTIKSNHKSQNNFCVSSTLICLNALVDVEMTSKPSDGQKHEQPVKHHHWYMIYLNAGGAVNRKPSKQILDLFLIHTELHLRKIAREISYKWMHEQHAKQHNQLNSILGNTLHAIGFVPFQIATWHFRIYICIYLSSASYYYCRCAVHSSIRLCHAFAWLI